MVGSRSRYILCVSMVLAWNSLASGAKRPAELPERSPANNNKPSPDEVPSLNIVHPFVDVEMRGFVLDHSSIDPLKPSCLKKSGIDLVAIDPGHDDSPASRRSDALVRGQENRGTQFLWPKVHEGHLNQVVSWIIYELLVNHPQLNLEEKNELQTMIRFSRYPGEKTFGQYEKQFGYASKTQGQIDFTITNRKERVNFMMKNHRFFDPSATNGWSNQTRDVSSQTLFVSVHADSSEYFNEGDHSWIIPPKGLSPAHENKVLQGYFVKGFSQGFGGYFQLDAADSDEVKGLKQELQETVLENNIMTHEHRLNLAMLSGSVGNSQTLKFLTEGFVMNGKAGNLANKDITNSENTMSLVFKRNGQIVQSYDYARLYGAYAESIAKSISDAHRCL